MLIMELQRYMFINGGKSEAVVDVKAYENVGIFAMLAEGERIEELIETHAVPENQQYVLFSLRIPAGAIHGFVAYRTPELTISSSEQLTVLTQKDKDKWPEPPPRLVQDFAGYATRYAGFLIAKSGTREERPHAQRIEPARTRVQ